MNIILQKVKTLTDRVKQSYAKSPDEQKKELEIGNEKVMQVLANLDKPSNVVCVLCGKKDRLKSQISSIPESARKSIKKEKFMYTLTALNSIRYRHTLLIRLIMNVWMVV
jgi:hypothetical protein